MKLLTKVVHTYIGALHCVLLSVHYGVLCLRYYSVYCLARQYLTMVVYIGRPEAPMFSSAQF